MCPGGFIIPSATLPDEVVVNGMSSSKRNSPFANSAIVVTVKPEDLRTHGHQGALKGVCFQRELETRARSMANHGQRAPAQRLLDFISKKVSSSTPVTSYFPGVVSSPLHELFSSGITETLCNGFAMFDKKMRGFLSSDAMLLGVETRTSSPVRIPRNENFMHVQIEGLYPCGEGSGYAGGITSSALDGINAASHVSIGGDFVGL